MPFTRIDLSTGDAERKLARIRGRFANYEVVMRGPLLEAIQNAIQTQFDTEGEYFGTPWQELSQTRIAERERHGIGGEHPILQGETGRLIDSLVKQTKDTVLKVTPKGFILRSRVPYFYAHQEGRGNNPERLILPDTVPDDLLLKLRNIITGYLIGVEYRVPSE